MTLHVLQPGLCTLVVDQGRPRSRSLGVPVGGAADRTSLALGNLLIGNPPETAALEINLAGPRLRAEHSLACVVYGARSVLHSARQPLTPGTTFTLEEGDELSIGSSTEGARAYLCIRGGIQTPLVLDSRSAFDPLQVGDVLPCHSARTTSRFIRPDRPWGQQPVALRVLAGPQADWFLDNVFFAEEYTVTPASNRMGVRLHGRPLEVPPRELVSEPVAPGAVQVTRDGQCIVLGVDGQTIGGYPKIAHVISADLDTLGQLRPGDRVRFTPVDSLEAEALYRQLQEELLEWEVRLCAI